MRASALALLLTAGTLPAQSPAAPPATAPSDAQSALTQALLGRWIGVLEYRDYSEPPTSTKRVQLPTWLSIAPAPGSTLALDYTYDDGPTKTVTEHDLLALDVAARTYTSTSEDHKSQTYTIANPDQLKDGRGTLVLTGPGTDNNKPAEIRTTWTIRRNLLSWLEEVRPARHALTPPMAPLRSAFRLTQQIGDTP